jgi:glucose-1-phosphate adenylyltransferase
MLLGGGRGERLLPLTTSRCKPAVPFAGHYRIIDFTLSNCLNSGLRRVGILTQFKSQLLHQHLHNGWDLFNPRLNEFIEIIPAQQQKGSHWYEGTADALYQNLAFIESHDPANVLILAGDHIYQADYRRMIAHHQRSDADITVAHISVPLHNAEEVGVLTTNEAGLITHFHEKPDSNWCTPDSRGCITASMGIYIFKRAVLEDLLNIDAESKSSSHDFGKDILPAALTHQETTPIG